MRQLVDHFQQTSYTPRNFNALLPTPRYSHKQTNLPPGAVITDFIDPNCFEEGAVTCTSFSSFNSSELSVDTSGDIDNSKKWYPLPKGTVRVRRESIGGEDGDILRMDSGSTDDVQAYLDAPINAAVNVALKCATREASFEEVLSWLIGASSHQSGYEYSPPPERERQSTSSPFFPPNDFVSLSSAYNLP